MSNMQAINISMYPELLFFKPTITLKNTRKDVKYTAVFNTVVGYPISSIEMKCTTNAVTNICIQAITANEIETIGVNLVVSLFS